MRGPGRRSCRRATAASLVWKIGEKLMERADEIARLETLHNGKPIFESRHIEVPAAAECFQYYAGWADKIHGETIPVRRQLPHLHAARAGRRGRGDRAVELPVAADRVESRAGAGLRQRDHHQAGEPDAADGDCARPRSPAKSGCRPASCNVITGPGARVGQMLVEHPGIDKIAFTGDTSTGKGIMQGSAETLKKITLELGGKSPNIVFPDADLDAALRGATTGIFYGKGEVCAAGSRLLVDKSIKSEFIDKLAARAKKMAPAIRWIRRPGSAPSRRRSSSKPSALYRHRQERRRDARRRRRARRYRHRQGLLSSSRRSSTASRPR